MIRLITPEDGAVFSVLTDAQRELVKRVREGTFGDFGPYREDNTGEDGSYPAVCVFRWTLDDPEFPSILEISETGDFTDRTCLEISPAFQDAVSREYFAVVCNFCTGREYFWRVRQRDGFSEVRAFSTLPDQIRPLFVESVPNFRDLGGRKNKEGRRVKQGLLFRGRFLEWEEDERHGLTENGKLTFAEKLGIKTEIDLREEMTGKLTASPAGESVRYVHVAHDSSWGGTLNERGMGQLRQVLDVLLDPASYPVYFHCYAGADRTGFIGMMIDSILGMSDGEIILEYDFTSMFDHRNWKKCEGAREYLKFLWETFGERPIAETVWVHLTNYGIDERDLIKIREFLLE